MQRHLREGSEICDELIATDRLLGSNEEEDEDLIDPERLTYFQVFHHFSCFCLVTCFKVIFDPVDQWSVIMVMMRMMFLISA